MLQLPQTSEIPDKDAQGLHKVTGGTEEEEEEGSVGTDPAGAGAEMKAPSSQLCRDLGSSTAAGSDPALSCRRQQLLLIWCQHRSAHSEAPGKQRYQHSCCRMDASPAGDIRSAPCGGTKLQPRTLPALNLTAAALSLGTTQIPASNICIKAAWPGGTASAMGLSPLPQRCPLWCVHVYMCVCTCVCMCTCVSMCLCGPVIANEGTAADKADTGLFYALG